eukprot:6179817-Pleurochrysis_carterae.AAC.3
MTRSAFENAMVLIMALGGSTNAVLHLIAMAKESRGRTHAHAHAGACTRMYTRARAQTRACTRTRTRTCMYARTPNLCAPRACALQLSLLIAYLQILDSASLVHNSTHKQRASARPSMKTLPAAYLSTTYPRTILPSERAHPDSHRHTYPHFHVPKVPSSISHAFTAAIKRPHDPCCACARTLKY